MWYYSGRIIRHPKPIKVDDILYPSSIFTKWPNEKLAQLEIYPYQTIDAPVGYKTTQWTLELVDGVMVRRAVTWELIEEEDEKLEKEKQKAKEKLIKEIEKALEPLLKKYGIDERDTWEQQTKEAIAYLEDEDVTVNTEQKYPLLYTIATVAELDGDTIYDKLTTLVIKVLTNRDEWIQAAGYVVGMRIKLHTQIDSAQTIEELENIDLTIVLPTQA